MTPIVAEVKISETNSEIKAELCSATDTATSNEVDTNDYALNLAIALSQSEHEARLHEEVEALGAYELFNNHKHLNVQY